MNPSDPNSQALAMMLAQAQQNPGGAGMANGPNPNIPPQQGPQMEQAAPMGTPYPSPLVELMAELGGGLMQDQSQMGLTGEAPIRSNMPGTGEIRREMDVKQHIIDALAESFMRDDVMRMNRRR